MDKPALPPEALEFAHKMFDFARSGDLALLEYVDHGLAADLRDSGGNSLLMLAAYHGNAQLVTELANRGADPDLANVRGQTPLSGAVFKGEDGVVAALLSAGADASLGVPSAIETAKMFNKHYFD